MRVKNYSIYSVVFKTHDRAYYMHTRSCLSNSIEGAEHAVQNISPSCDIKPGTGRSYPVDFIDPNLILGLFESSPRRPQYSLFKVTYNSALDSNFVVTDSREKVYSIIQDCVYDGKWNPKEVIAEVQCIKCIHTVDPNIVFELFENSEVVQ